MKIAIIGTGYVGLVSGACFADTGFEVMCIDIDKEKIENLKKGVISIYEPGLKELVMKNHCEKRLQFSTNIGMGIKFADVIFSAVGTPPDKDHKADLKYVKQVAESFGQHIDKYKIFVTKSTVPVGTNELCRQIIEKELEKRSANIKFDIASNPEFLREGSAIKDTIDPDRIIIGVKAEKAKKILAQLYEPFVSKDHPLVFTDIRSAEIIKYAANAFLATKISFINEIANFCKLIGADIQEVSKGIGLDGRIGSRFLHAGIGYGGSCLPKDVKALIQKGKDSNFDFKILKAVEKVNEEQKELFLTVLDKNFLDLKDKNIAILGLAFKPNTDDIREAPSLKIIEGLLKKGATVIAYDPEAMKNVKDILGKQISYAKNPLDCTKDADATLILTEWDEFRALDLKELKKAMKGNLLLDGRNIYKIKGALEAGFEYIPIGRATDSIELKNLSNKHGGLHIVPRKSQTASFIHTTPR